MARDTVFIDFQIGDTSSVDAKAAQLSKEEQAALDKGNKALADRAKLAQQNVIALGKQLQAQKTITEAFKKQFVSAKTVGDQIIALGNTFDVAFKSGGAETVQAVYAALGEQVKGTGLSVEQFIKQLETVDPATKLVSDTTKALTEDTRSLSAELQTVKNQMAVLAIQGETNSKQYKDLQDKAISYQNAISNVNETVKTNVKTSAGLSQVSDVLGTVNSTAQVLVGTYGLFNSENKELEKALTTLNSVMLITNGVESIAVSLKKSDSLVTRALTVAQNAFTTALYGTTAGLTAVQTAIAATGVGVLVVALGYAIAKLVQFVSKATDATDAIKNFKSAIDFLDNSLAAQRQEIQNNAAINIEAAKQQKDAFTDTYNIRAKELKDLTAAQQTHTRLVSHQLDLMKDKSSDTYKGLAKDSEEYKKLLAETYLDEKKSKEAETDLIQQQALLQEQYQTESYNRRVQALAKYTKESNEIYNRTAEYQIQQEEQLSQDTTKEYETRLAALNNSNNLRKGLIEKQRQQDLNDARKDATTTSETLLNINDKYNVARENADNEAFEKRKALTRQHVQENAQAEFIVQQNVIKQRLDVVERGTQEQLQLQTDLINAEAAQQIQAIQFSVTNEKLRNAQIEQIKTEANARILANNEAFYTKQMQDANEFTRVLHDYAIAQANAQNVGLDKNSSQVFETEQDNRRILVQETNDEIARLDFAFQSGQLRDEQAYWTKRVALQTQAVNQQVAIDQAAAERRKKINDAIVSAVLDTAQTISDAAFSSDKNKRDAELQNEISQLDKLREAELDNENLTEQQKEQIQARYDAKERQVKRQAAQRDKQAAILQASINAAIAITKALTSAIPPFNFIAAAVVAAAAAVQITQIKSTPIPAYAKGTKSAQKGKAWINEKGPELVEMKGGEIVHTADETLAILQKLNAGRAYINNKSLAEYSQAVDTNRLTGAPSKSNSIDMDKLAEIVGQQLEKHRGPTVHTIIDKNGADQWVEDAGNRRRYLNKKYSL